MTKLLHHNDEIEEIEEIQHHPVGLAYLGNHIETKFVAETTLPTKEGIFRFRAYRSRGDLCELEPIALIHGDIYGKHNVNVRVHDQCITSEVFGSLKCDCKDQLEYAKQYIVQHSGVVIYMPQEGRGIGLANKVKAYALQELGMDTVDANRSLGYKDDYRSYEPVEFILKDLKIQSIQLLTNNPRKIQELTRAGIHIQKRIPIIMSPGEHNQNYLHTKAFRMAHLLEKQPSSTHSHSISIPLHTVNSTEDISKWTKLKTTCCKDCNQEENYVR